MDQESLEADESQSAIVASPGGGWTPVVQVDEEWCDMAARSKLNLAGCTNEVMEKIDKAPPCCAGNYFKRHQRLRSENAEAVGRGRRSARPRRRRLGVPLGEEGQEGEGERGRHQGVVNVDDEQIDRRSRDRPQRPTPERPTPEDRPRDRPPTDPEQPTPRPIPRDRQ